MSQVNIGPYCDGRVVSDCVGYCGLYGGIEFPETGYEAGDWVLYNTMASGRVISGQSYWCEVGTYRNGYGAEYLFTCFSYPNRKGDATQLHTLDRSRHITNTADGPMVSSPFIVKRSPMAREHGWLMYRTGF